MQDYERQRAIAWAEVQMRRLRERVSYDAARSKERILNEKLEHTTIIVLTDDTR